MFFFFLKNLKEPKKTEKNLVLKRRFRFSKYSSNSFGSVPVPKRSKGDLFQNPWFSSVHLGSLRRTHLDRLRERRHRLFALGQQPLRVRRQPELAPFQQPVVEIGVVEPHAAQVHVRLGSEQRREAGEETQPAPVVRQGRAGRDELVDDRLLLSFEQKVVPRKPVRKPARNQRSANTFDFCGAVKHEEN